MNAPAQLRSRGVVLEVAHAKSVRQLEELVAGKSPGDTPTSAPQPSERRHILRFEVAPETFALFREAIMALRRSSDSALDDDSALLAMARHVLGGPRDEGRASYQIALTVCTECGRGHQPSGGDLVAVGSDIVAMAHCDGQHLGCIAPRAGNDSAFPDGPDSSGSAYVGADLHAESDSVPAYVGANVHAHAAEPQANAHVGANVHAHAEDRQANAHVGATGHAHAQGQANAHVGANAPPTRGRARALARAKQSIPPALRRAVLARDHRRCRVPGCRNSAFVDVHHIELRSEGGGNEAENLIVLCGAHHRAAHRGRLLVQGASATAAGFRHADGSPYGQVGQPQALDVRAKTFSALRNLGFREGEVRAVLARLGDEGELAVGTLEQWLRAALARLTR